MMLLTVFVVRVGAGVLFVCVCVCMCVLYLCPCLCVCLCVCVGCVVRRQAVNFALGDWLPYGRLSIDRQPLPPLSPPPPSCSHGSVLLGPTGWDADSYWQ